LKVDIKDFPEEFLAWCSYTFLPLKIASLWRLESVQPEATVAIQDGCHPK